uniref:Putative secreted protein n=1 Tax=Anopheles darlingi TaxID=43151 RepID=A0A2M4D5N6_ANODA
MLLFFTPRFLLLVVSLLFRPDCWVVLRMVGRRAAAGCCCSPVVSSSSSFFFSTDLPIRSLLSRLGDAWWLPLEGDTSLFEVPSDNTLSPMVAISRGRSSFCCILGALLRAF